VNVELLLTTTRSARKSLDLNAAVDLDEIHECLQIGLLVIPCYESVCPRQDGDESFYLATLYGSIFPAVWNFALALHSRGYGTCIATLHLHHEQAIAVPPTIRTTLRTCAR